MLGSKIWNGLPLNKKAETSYHKFKEHAAWFGPECKWNICRFSC